MGGYPKNCFGKLLVGIRIGNKICSNFKISKSVIWNLTFLLRRDDS